jgi:serine/threonine protein kinase
MSVAHDGPCPRQAAPRNLLQGRYELIGPLGQGGMGTVYMARDLHLHNRPCVVKRLRDDFSHEDDKKKAVAFFEREADVLSRLQHPNIVHILDYFEEGSNYFLVMEYVEGRDLQDVLGDRALPFEQNKVLEWASQICDVLEYLHGHQPPVIYRDLKPSNIMIDVKGRVKLVDFGIARPWHENSDNTHVVSGGYSPPEQYWGAADPRSDIYALGATMYFLLTGNEPVALHCSSPRQANLAVSSSIDNIVQKATDQDPNHRYQSARQMAEALKAPPETAKPLATKGRWTTTIPVLLLIALALVGWFGYSRLQGLHSLLQSRQEQIAVKEQAIAEGQKEKLELNKKIQAFSRAIDAQQQAVWETHKPSSSNKIIADKSAMLLTEEADLTDPAGLQTPKEESQLFSLPWAKR